jgi:hypothetical protein
MRIEYAIKKIHSLPHAWVRADQIQRVRGGLDIFLGVYKGRRGKKVQDWRIQCDGVRGFSIADVDGGGLALYPATHPAARQFAVRQAVLRWSGGDSTAALGAIYQAHIGQADDWIDLDIYQMRAIMQGKRVYRGADFLMRACEKALRQIGAKPKLTVQKERTAKIAGPRVLHFGGSHVVANSFLAENLD